MKFAITIHDDGEHGGDNIILIGDITTRPDAMLLERYSDDGCILIRKKYNYIDIYRIADRMLCIYLRRDAFYHPSRLYIMYYVYCIL